MFIRVASRIAATAAVVAAHCFPGLDVFKPPPQFAANADRGWRVASVPKAVDRLHRDVPSGCEGSAVEQLRHFSASLFLLVTAAYLLITPLFAIYGIVLDIRNRKGNYGRVPV
jgi:hypothetical protein